MYGFQEEDRWRRGPNDCRTRLNPREVAAFLEAQNQGVVPEAVPSSETSFRPVWPHEPMACPFWAVARGGYALLVLCICAAVGGIAPTWCLAMLAGGQLDIGEGVMLLLLFGVVGVLIGAVFAGGEFADVAGIPRSEGMVVMPVIGVLAAPVGGWLAINAVGASGGLTLSTTTSIWLVIWGLSAFVCLVLFRPVPRGNKLAQCLALSTASLVVLTAAILLRGATFSAYIPAFAAWSSLAASLHLPAIRRRTTI